ncbi:MAG: AraC family transcriptional regulator [Leptospirales bacterium]|jgi:AraC-like DNA-binding protein
MMGPENLELTRFERRLLRLVSPARLADGRRAARHPAEHGAVVGLRVPRRMGEGWIYVMSIGPNLEALAIDCRGGQAGIRFGWRSDHDLQLLRFARRGRSMLSLNGAAPREQPAGRPGFLRIAQGGRIEWALSAGESIRELIFYSSDGGGLSDGGFARGAPREWRVPRDEPKSDPSAQSQNAPPGTEQARLSLLVDRLFETVVIPGPEAQALALLAFAWMIEAGPAGPSAPEPRGPHNRNTPSLNPGLPASELRKIHQARSIVYREYLDPPTTIRLARRVALNEYKLKRGYRQVFGTSIYADLRRYRMHLARDLLLAGESSVASAACAVGYSNPGHFARAFQAEFGLLPGRVTRSNRPPSPGAEPKANNQGSFRFFHENETQSQ